MRQSVFEEALEIPGYLSEGLIGRGGMGAVYRAIQLAHSRPVALKVLGEAYRDDPEFVARFRREAELLATLEHPHIVPMLDAGQADGVPYIVMRLIDGPNLRELIRVGVPEPATAVQLLGGIAEALDFAHVRGVLHRDVKPHNMLLDHGGHVWLADFGLTRLSSPLDAITVGSRIAGTFDYLSPELAAGEPASVASDVYALAISAFQLLTGELPFGSQPAAALLQAHAGAARPAASAINGALSRRVDSVLADGMAADPAARPASAGAFVAALADALDLPSRAAMDLRLGIPVLVQPIESATSASALTDAETKSAVDLGAVGSSPRRRPPLVFAGALSLIVVVVAAVLLLTARSPARAHRSTALDVLRVAAVSAITPFDYRDAGGAHGETLASGRRVAVSCRVSGRAESGDVWWYRIASEPWEQQFYAPAADFGRTGGPYDAAVPVCDYMAEVPGNRLGTYTWTDYHDSGGREGAKLPGFTPAEVLCRLKGLVVPDGNPWWYRIGGRPWDGRFYASADAFYNNGETHGTLHGTAFVDMKVPLCAAASAPGGDAT